MLFISDSRIMVNDKIKKKILNMFYGQIQSIAKAPQAPHAGRAPVERREVRPRGLKASWYGRDPKPQGSDAF
jgi:hypothetical protein